MRPPVFAGAGRRSQILPSHTLIRSRSSQTLDIEIKGRACVEEPLRRASGRIATPTEHHTPPPARMHCACCIPACHPCYPTEETSAGKLFVFGCSHLFLSSSRVGSYGPQFTLTRTLNLSLAVVLSLCLCSCCSGASRVRLHFIFHLATSDGPTCSPALLPLYPATCSERP